MTAISAPMLPPTGSSGSNPLAVAPKATKAPPGPAPTTIASAADAALHHVEGKLRAHLDGLNRDRLTDEGVKAVVQQFAASVSPQVDLAVAAVDRRAQQAEKHVADVMAALSADSDTAGELRRDRAWNSAVRQLDSASANDVVETARRLVEKSDGTTLGALAQQLPGYLSSRTSGDNAWLDDVLTQRVPELASAREELKRAQQAQQITAYHAKALRERMTATSPQEYQDIRWVSPSKYDPDA